MGNIKTQMKDFSKIRQIIRESVKIFFESHESSEDFFPIDTPVGSKELEMMKAAFDKGIDSHLEGFTKSKIGKSETFDNKIRFNIHKDEIPLLLRRLEEIYDENGDLDYISFKEDIQQVANETPEMSEEHMPETPEIEPNPESPVQEEAKEGESDQFERVIFLQDSEADEALDILHHDGPEAALEHLKQWHYPGEHMIEDNPGHGTADKTFEKDGYIMSWNPHLGYIALSHKI